MNSQFKARYKVNLIAENGHHFYQIDNDPTYLPGVTTILDVIGKPALVPWSSKETALYIASILRKTKTILWSNKNENRSHLDDKFLEILVKRAKKQPRFIKEKAAQLGTAAHSVFEDILKERKNGLDYQSVLVQSFYSWLEGFPFSFIAGDTKVGSMSMGYGGSLDAMALNDQGELMILDFKTGKGIYGIMASQVAAYGHCAMELYGLKKWPEGYIIHFDKDKPSYAVHKVKSMEDSFEVFKAAFEIYKRSKMPAFETAIKTKLRRKKDDATAARV